MIAFKAPIGSKLRLSFCIRAKYAYIFYSKFFFQVIFTIF